MADVKDFGFDEEWGEEVLHKHFPTNWPQSHRRWRLIYEVQNQSIEEIYYLVIDLHIISFSGLKLQKYCTQKSGIIAIMSFAKINSFVLSPGLSFLAWDLYCIK